MLEDLTQMSSKLVKWKIDLIKLRMMSQKDYEIHKIG